MLDNSDHKSSRKSFSLFKFADFLTIWAKFSDSVKQVSGYVHILHISQNALICGVNMAYHIGAES